MTDLFQAAHGGPPAAVNPGWATVHIAVGVAVLLFMIWRLGLRHTEGFVAHDDVMTRMIRPAR
jgi:hypothetical protein